MKPGSLRIVGSKGPRDRVLHKFPKGMEGQENAFYDMQMTLFKQGYELHYYEMTDKGWTEF